jgi:ABC-2 type transport system ATP-binding protein
MLTTQYLEEADALAERVGIIDQGRIVAEGTPGALKAEVGRPSLEITPSDPGGCDRLGIVLSRFGEQVESHPGTVAVRLERGADELASVVRALDAEDVGIEHFQLHSPSLDDVFLAKTGHKLDVGGDAAPERGRRGGAGDEAPAEAVA